MLNERLKRTRLLLGADAMDRLKQAHVVVVGLGAVGGYALEGLVRSGIGQLTLVDFDVVAESNINRQILASSDTIGIPKVEVARKRVLSINPDCQVELMRGFLDEAMAEQLSALKPDYLVDAIDALNSKVNLLVCCTEHQTPVVSSMGAALRRDPQKVRIGKLMDIHHCPLGKTVRQRMRRRVVNIDWVDCVYSAEPLPSPLPLAEPEPNPEDRGRLRNTLGSMSTITGIFGLTIANQVILQITSPD